MEGDAATHVGLPDFMVSGMLTKTASPLRDTAPGFAKHFVGVKNGCSTRTASPFTIAGDMPLGEGRVRPPPTRTARSRRPNLGDLVYSRENRKALFDVGNGENGDVRDKFTSLI